jgi:hypothetical protein
MKNTNTSSLWWWMDFVGGNLLLVKYGFSLSHVIHSTYIFPYWALILSCHGSCTWAFIISHVMEYSFYLSFWWRKLPTKYATAGMFTNVIFHVLASIYFSSETGSNKIGRNFSCFIIIKVHHTQIPHFNKITSDNDVFSIWIEQGRKIGDVSSVLIRAVFWMSQELDLLMCSTSHITISAALGHFTVCGVTELHIREFR